MKKHPNIERILPLSQILQRADVLYAKEQQVVHSNWDEKVVWGAAVIVITVSSFVGNEQVMVPFLILAGAGLLFGLLRLARLHGQRAQLLNNELAKTGDLGKTETSLTLR